MDKIKVVTDCTGIKQLVIRNVFSSRFLNQEIEIALRKGPSFITPLTLEDFPTTTLKRFQWIRENLEDPNVYIATIQKGYYRSQGLWFLTACVGIAHPRLPMICSMASSVCVGSKSSMMKSENISRNMSDIIAEVYPRWDRANGSVYTLLTGEGEVEWLGQPLRHQLKALPNGVLRDR